MKKKLDLVQLKRKLRESLVGFQGRYETIRKRTATKTGNGHEDDVDGDGGAPVDVVEIDDVAKPVSKENELDTELYIIYSYWVAESEKSHYQSVTNPGLQAGTANLNKFPAPNKSGPVVPPNKPLGTPNPNKRKNPDNDDIDDEVKRTYETPFTKHLLKTMNKEEIFKYTLLLDANKARDAMLHQKKVQELELSSCLHPR